jgi:hypothetical protein
VGCLSVFASNGNEKRDVCLRGCLRDHKSFYPDFTIFLQLYFTKLLLKMSSSSTDVCLLCPFRTRRNNLCGCIWSLSKVSQDPRCAVMFVLHYHDRNCKAPLERFQFPVHVCSLPLPLQISESFSKLFARRTQTSSQPAEKPIYFLSLLSQISKDLFNDCCRWPINAISHFLKCKCQLSMFSVFCASKFKYQKRMISFCPPFSRAEQRSILFYATCAFVCLIYNILFKYILSWHGRGGVL